MSATTRAIVPTGRRRTWPVDTVGLPKTGCVVGARSNRSLGSLGGAARERGCTCRKCRNRNAAGWVPATVRAERTTLTPCQRQENGAKNLDGAYRAPRHLELDAGGRLRLESHSGQNCCERG